MDEFLDLIEEVAIEAREFSEFALHLSKKENNPETLLERLNKELDASFERNNIVNGLKYFSEYGTKDENDELILKELVKKGLLLLYFGPKHVAENALN